ncbi:MAG: hypothetical protein ABIQ27_07180 [Flavobacterium sp.]|uniref:hypothetical protein n=1 Tax=Flavobacterium sp. TaxID=239 RepID=UPI003265C030
MESSTYYKIAKFFLVIPLLAGLLTLVEQFLPFQKMTTVVESKSISERQRFGTTTYNIRFTNNNDQFTEKIYNALTVGDSVQLEVRYFTKEVSSISLKNNSVVIKNSTKEIYFILGIGLALFGFSVFFLRKSYYTRKNYRFIILLCFFGFVNLVRIISLNT